MVKYNIWNCCAFELFVAPQKLRIASWTRNGTVIWSTWSRTWSSCCGKESSGTPARCLCSTWKTPTARARKKTTPCQCHGSGLDITDAILGSVKTCVTAPRTWTPTRICVILHETTSSSYWWRSMRPEKETMGVLLSSVTGNDQQIQFSPISDFLDVVNEFFRRNMKWYYRQQ